MGWTVSNYGKGGGIGDSGSFWFWYEFCVGYTFFFCLMRPIVPPGIFESGEKNDLDPLSGANHAIYAQFMAQSALANRGKQVGLLQGAGAWFATWFYAVMRLLCLKGPLKSTIYQQKFRDLDLNSSAKAAVRDIEDDKL